MNGCGILVINCDGQIKQQYLEEGSSVGFKFTDHEFSFTLQKAPPREHHHTYENLDEKSFDELTELLRKLINTLQQKYSDLESRYAECSY